MHKTILTLVLASAGFGLASWLATPAQADTTPTDMTIHVGIPPQPTAYVVKNGDYLAGIADSNDISWPSIYQANDTISNPDLIYPNQTITIPPTDIPLTRNLPESTLTVPTDYSPQPLAPTKTGQTNGGLQHLSADVISHAAPGIGNALSLVGLPYVYGGTTPAGFDCSGLVQYIAAEKGIHLPRTVMEQYAATQRIGKADLQPGDLVFFNSHHVGMYIGNNQVIHATNPAQGVRLDSLDVAIEYNGYMGAGRM